MATIQTYISNTRMPISRVRFYVPVPVSAVLFLLLSADCSGAAHSDTEKILRLSTDPLIAQYDPLKKIHKQAYYSPQLVAQLGYLERVTSKYGGGLSILTSAQLSHVLVRYVSGHWLNVFHELLKKDFLAKETTYHKQIIKLIKAAEQAVDYVYPGLGDLYFVSECESNTCPLSRSNNPAIRTSLVDRIKPIKSDIKIAFFGSGRLRQELVILDHLRRQNIFVSDVALIDMEYGAMQGGVNQEEKIFLEKCKNFMVGGKGPESLSRLLDFASVYVHIQQFNDCLNRMYDGRKPLVRFYSRESDYTRDSVLSKNKIDMVLGVDLPEKEASEYCWSGFHTIC
jgi:hypothetical protein